MLPPPISTLFPYTTLFRSLTGSPRIASFIAPATRRLLGAFRRISEFAAAGVIEMRQGGRSEEHTSELQSLRHLVCRLLLEKKNEKVDVDQANRITRLREYR